MSPGRCLVTGVAGFAGSHLASELLAEGYEVTGLALPGEKLFRIDHVLDKLDLRFADVSDFAALEEALRGVEADFVFHLAAVASVPAAFADPTAAVRVNTLGTANLLEWTRTHGARKFVYISSADVYGQADPRDMPLRETRTLKPANPYAASKAAAETIALQYWRTFALPVVVLRPFNHTGARQGPGFAPSDFAIAIARMERAGVPEPLAVGNLDTLRDYSDVGDIVRGYLAAALRGEAGEVYNIASGRAIAIREILETLLSFTELEIEVTTDPAKARPSDTPLVVGDSSKFITRTGWRPGETPLSSTLSELLDSWRNQLQPGTA